MTPEQIARECEKLFQNGGPKVYTFDPENSVIKPSPHNPSLQLKYAVPGVQVWARRKSRKSGRYEFQLMGIAVGLTKAAEPKMNPWMPMKSAIDLKHLGKLGEELGECSAAVSRCIIQGVDEVEPVTKKVNKQWLSEEIADVLANAHLVIDHFGLNPEFINERAEKKRAQLKIWHNMAD